MKFATLRRLISGRSPAPSAGTPEAVFRGFVRVLARLVPRPCVLRDEP